MSLARPSTFEYAETKHEDIELSSGESESDTISDIDDESDAPQSQQKRSRCSNLPIIQWCQRWKCCVFCKRHRIYDSLLTDTDSNNAKSSTQKAEEALIYEECINATTDKIVENCSWVNATIFSLALRTTVYVNFGDISAERNICRNAWIYFATIFLAAVVCTFAPKCCVRTDSLKKQLQSEHEAQLSKERMSAQQLSPRKQDMYAAAGSLPVDDINPALLPNDGTLVDADSVKKEAEIRMEMKIFLYVEQEVNDLLQKFQNLAIASLTLAVAIGWRDAAQSTLAVLVSDTIISTSIYFVYAMLMTILGIYVVVRLNKYFERKKQFILKYLQNSENTNTYESERKLLLKYAFDRRTIAFADSAIKFAIAWSWRSCTNAFIRQIYGDAEDAANPVLNHWGYTVILSLFVSVLYAVNDDYYIIYPRNKDSQAKYDTNTSRTLTNTIIYENLRFVVGMSWFDSLMVTANASHLSPKELTAVYWAIALSGIILSVMGTHYMTRFNLQKKISYKGLAQAMFDTFERFYDPECLVHSEESRDMIPAILDNTMFELISVTFHGWGIGASLSLINAITFTVYLVVPGFDETVAIGPNINYAVADKDNVYIFWITALICLGITLATTAYVGRLVSVIRTARRGLFKTLFKQKKKQLRKLRREMPVARCPMPTMRRKSTTDSNKYKK
eukprot:CAMPEP_0197033802 /NCGR_PEP_ID=MMETSP1384-20130603/12108_1 /TAXON_ID=29189 /ORGANISM="Ammonia sp." /LENGTH=676 /DNA_ID=CAMNT_0042463659 /DNA_START=45 /DNA_END=2075 /DNA_ORIENTATION=+